jgi:hypothetical protein
LNRGLYDNPNQTTVINEQQQQFIQSPLSQQPLTPTNQLHIINPNQAITIQKQENQQTYTIIMAPPAQQQQMQVQQLIDQSAPGSSTSTTAKPKKPKQPSQKKKSIKDIQMANDQMSKCFKLKFFRLNCVLNFHQK